MDDDARQVLRELWSARDQRSEDLEAACGPQRTCQNMSAVGFDGLASGGNLRDAWRTQLAKEGKLKPGTGTLRDLVLGPDQKA
jgi:hypothetical protein